MVLMAGILRWLKLEWWMASGRVDYKRGRYQAALQSSAVTAGVSMAERIKADMR
jgi:hypothetical protein